MKQILILVFGGLLVGSLGAQTQFQSVLDPAQIVPTTGQDPDGVSGFSGAATMTYQNNGSPKLDYSIFLPGLDLDGNRTPGNFADDVTAIHIHFGAPGANGPHALNIFGISAGQVRQDDADMRFDSANATVTGRWDDSDQLFTGLGGLQQPFDSVSLSGATNDLFGGGLYYQVHTVNFPNGELRGQLVPVPEPSAIVLIGCGLSAVFGGIHRGRKTSINTKS